MVHLPSSERVGLPSRASIYVTILYLRTIIGVVSSLPALETGNMAQILLGGCCRVGTALTVVSSIPISILGPLGLCELPPL